jgi:hypothetical protein
VLHGDQGRRLYTISAITVIGSFVIEPHLRWARVHADVRVQSGAQQLLLSTSSAELETQGPGRNPPGPDTLSGV